MFAGMSSYIEALESRVSSLEPLLPQAQRAELQVVEALARANSIEARVSLVVPWDLPGISTPLIDGSLNSTLPFYDNLLPSSLYSSPMSPLLQRIDPCCLFLRANYAPLEGCDYYL
jgi:hypothetical protein